jgi:spermidine synthase
MNEKTVVHGQGSSHFPHLPLLLLLFAGSGCAALIYEVVWFQMLQLVLGSSAVSLAVVLGTFMGGMCLGSLAWPRFVSPQRPPLKMFALLEGGIGLCGLIILVLVPFSARLYVAAAAHGMPGFLLRGSVCALCLLPPTVLMGATLPAISRFVETTPAGLSWLGFLYAGNVSGAIFGCLLSGFYLLRVHDMATATFVAVGVNACVALGSLCVAFWVANDGIQAITSPMFPSLSSASASSSQSPFRIYLSIAFSGFTALAAEVAWTRHLALMLGATVYTFSIILAVFLAGLAIGGSAGASIAGRTSHSRIALAICQILLVPAIALTAHLLAKSLPYWPINPSLSRSPWFNFQLDLLRCTWAILPAACLWGASFPLALAAAARRSNDPAPRVGKVYASNTLGAIAGAVASSLFLIPNFGTQQLHRVLVAASALSGLLMVMFSKTGPISAEEGQTVKTVSAGGAAASTGLKPGINGNGSVRYGFAFNALFSTALVLAVLAWTLFLARDIPKVPWDLIAYGRYLPSKTELGTNLYVGEGMNASVAVVELSTGVRTFHVSGKVEASTEGQDMRLQRMLGHLPALLHPEPRSVLVVGCGAGVTAGSFTLHPGVEKITICEIEPLIPKAVTPYFNPENYGVTQNPRVKLVIDDARHYVLTARDKFDIITSDPIHPWVKGAATLYTREYFETCKHHLNRGGLVTQWVPLYESNPAAVKSEIATFFEVFTNGTIWSNDDAGEGYDLVLLGEEGNLRIDLGQVQRRLNRDDFKPVLDSLRNAGFKSAFSLLATYAGQAADLKPWLRGAEINRDINLRLQYLAGMGLNLYQPDSIYSDILFYRRYPKALFADSDEWGQALRLAIEKPPQR